MPQVVPVACLLIGIRKELCCPFSSLALNLDGDLGEQDMFYPMQRCIIRQITSDQ